MGAARMGTEQTDQYRSAPGEVHLHAARSAPSWSSGPLCEFYMAHAARTTHAKGVGSDFRVMSAYEPASVWTPAARTRRSPARVATSTRRAAAGKT